MILHPKEGLYNYKCKVLRVIDGDSIEVDVDLGFSTWKKVTLRLSDIDTPEVRTKDLEEKKLGIEATEFVKNKLFENNPEGIIYIHSTSVDSFGRSLARVVTENGDNLNIILFESGLAKYWKK
jgi:endonuclease YncB( thermonuclease family)